MASGTEVHDLDLEVPGPRCDAMGGTHHAVALVASCGEAVVRELDPLGLVDAREEHRLAGCILRGGV